MSRWAAAFHAIRPRDTVYTDDTLNGGSGQAPHTVNRVNYVTGERDIGAWMLWNLWACGAAVVSGLGGALTITPHALSKRITAVLLGAARLHTAAPFWRV